MKYFLSIGLLFFLFSFTSAQNTLSATLSVPNQVTEGEDFSILLTIEKPENFRPYAVYTQKFPTGFFANTKSVSDADVSFQNQTLTITWMRLSPGNSLNIPLKTSYIKGLNGTFSFSGKLTYLIDNKKGEYRLKKQYVLIIPENTSTTSNLDEYGKNYKPFRTIKCLREVKLQKDRSYMVTISINKLENINNFILTEEVSQNFSISAADSPEIKILSKNRIIQFTKKNNSENKTLVFKYRLIPKKKNETRKPVIFGKLSFIDKDQIINIPVENQSPKSQF